MKFKQFIAMLLLLVVLLAGVCVQGADRKLTIKRAVLINDTQVVVEFSEPIAINKFETNRGPFIAIRLVNSSGAVQKVTDDKSPHYGTYLQWTGLVQYVDSKHDRLVVTLQTEVMGIKTMSEILNYKGLLAEYKQFPVVFTLEEVPYTTAEHYTDGYICNVTTKDGEVYLSATRHQGYESCNIPIENAYGYRVDLSSLEGTMEKKEIITEFEFPLVTLANEVPIEEIEDENSADEVLRNDPIITMAILGGSGLLCALLIVLAIVIHKKRKVVS